MELADFVALVRDNLGAEHLTFAGGDEPVFKVAVVGGSGSDFMEDALAAGADTLVTGDVKYHVAQKGCKPGPEHCRRHPPADGNARNRCPGRTAESLGR